MERRERLNLEIDTRLAAEIWPLVWGSALDEDEELRPLLAAALRSAYGAGYRDALREDREGRRGELARATGYTTERTQ